MISLSQIIAVRGPVSITHAQAEQLKAEGVILWSNKVCLESGYRPVRCTAITPGRGSGLVVLTNDGVGPCWARRVRGNLSVR